MTSTLSYLYFMPRCADPPASILIQWNRLLFEDFIPRAWSQLLDALSRTHPSVDIFTAWPTPQSFSKCGESVYWKSFTEDLLQIVLQEGLPVWPTVGGREYQPLENVLVASPEAPLEVLTALANVGMNVCGPLPDFLFHLVSSTAEWNHRILTPDSAADTLRVSGILSNTTIWLSAHRCRLHSATLSQRLPLQAPTRRRTLVSFSNTSSPRTTSATC